MKEPAAQSILPAVPNELRPHARKQMNLKTRDFFSGLLERTCTALRVNGHAREVIATRIIDLARNGIIDTKALSDRVIAETSALSEL